MTHLMAAERGKIEILIQEQYTNKNIALKLGRSSSPDGRPTEAWTRLAGSTSFRLR